MPSPNFEVQSRGRVTAGCPAVDPRMRDRADSEWLKREHIHASFAEREGRQREAAAPDGDRPTTVAAAQQGIMLHGSVIIERLKKLNPNFWFEVSTAIPENVGIYWQDKFAEGGRKYLGIAFYREMNPEFETKIPDDANQTVKMIRGWRTVLSRLIRKGYVTEARAAVLFGMPSRDSANWQRLTQ